MGSQVPAETWGLSGMEPHHAAEGMLIPCGFAEPRNFGSRDISGCCSETPGPIQASLSPWSRGPRRFAAGGGQMGQLLPLVTQRTNAAELSETTG